MSVQQLMGVGGSLGLCSPICFSCTSITAAPFADQQGTEGLGGLFYRAG
jgi:hypothetical protein